MILDDARVGAQLAAHPAAALPRGTLEPAAVLLPLFRRNGEEYLLLTRRSEQLRHHRGEIAFPGGRAHHDDVDLLQTALREAEEEVGLAPECVTLLGQLDECISVHGYHVTPFVGRLLCPPQWRVDHGEIAAVLEIPLTTLAETWRWHREDWQHRGRLEPVWFCRVDGYDIWGLTAAILRQLLLRLGLLREDAAQSGGEHAETTA